LATLFSPVHLSLALTLFFPMFLFIRIVSCFSLLRLSGSLVCFLILFPLCLLRWFHVSLFRLLPFYVLFLASFLGLLNHVVFYRPLFNNCFFFFCYNGLERGFHPPPVFFFFIASPPCFPFVAPYCHTLLFMMVVLEPFPPPPPFTVSHMLHLSLFFPPFSFL